jgi:hypothetical protein
VVQRRGGGVNTPEIGSRDGINCFGGISGFHAELRREIKWGNFIWWFLGFWAEIHVGTVRRGDNGVHLGECFGVLP